MQPPPTRAADAGRWANPKKVNWWTTVEDCSCAQERESVAEGSLELFAAIRSRCPVLNRIFVPDEIWPGFQQWHQQRDTVACHRSILLLAMERGYLGRVTSAVHRYLMNAGLPRPDVRRQYLQDLRERWMLYADPIERLEKARIFSGRLAELQCAEWLELQGWTVSGLEAQREGPDIEAYANEGQTTAFEVKLIGTEHDDFVTILESLAGQPAGGPVSPHDAANYLLFRVYEAAKQLQRSAYNRVAVVVVEALTWFRFQIQLKHGWINWANPSFLSSHTWEGFLARQRTRYPSLPDDLHPALQSLNAVWIVKQSEGYRYHRELEVSLKRA